MKITAAMVNELRQKTSAGIMDCKKALTETEGNVDAAIKLLREQGLKASELKRDRTASEGLIVSYIHGGNRIGALVELNCETDFVARTEQFQQLAKDIAMQVVASKPRYVSREDVPADVLESEREILRNQTLAEGKPEKIVDKIVDGRLNKFYAENCLLEQPFIRDTNRVISELIKEAITVLGENILVKRFCLFILGQD